MSKMQMTVSTRSDSMQGYVKEFTRHSNDVLLNLNELRHRDILTDATLLVGTARLRAHCAVLIACSGFFYSLFSRHKTSGVGEKGVSLSLSEGLDAGSVELLLDFMYTSRLPLSPNTVPGVLAAATYLQMEHVADTCRAFIQNSEVIRMTPPVVELTSRFPDMSFRANTGGRSPPAHPSFFSSPSRPAMDAEEPSPTRTRAPGDGIPLLELVACQTADASSHNLKVEKPDTSPIRPSPDSPCQSSGQPNSPAESSGCTLSPKLKPRTESRLTPHPKSCNWKKYKYIVLNPLCTTPIKDEGPGEEQLALDHSFSITDNVDFSPKASKEECSYQRLSPHRAENYTEQPAGSTQENRGCCSLYKQLSPPVLQAAKQNTQPFEQLSVKLENQSPVICYSRNQVSTKSTRPGEKPYQCNVCGAQFNRPANLKTHSRIHSGEKPYRCDTCGARFVQVAHLRAHVLIHTGEKPYPCHTCGTRFRHLQTLKSHLRIHTGEKPYSCEKCDLHFRHKSQMRLHLRQKHGAITNTKIRYKVLADSYQTGSAILQTC